MRKCKIRVKTKIRIDGGAGSVAGLAEAKPQGTPISDDALIKSRNS